MCHNLPRSPAEVKEVREEYKGRYCKVVGRRSEWVRYLRRPDVRHMWELRPASETVFRFSVAVVSKKDPPWLRKLAQCVPVNAATLAPGELNGIDNLDYGLVGDSAVGQVVGEDDRAAAHTLDESNAFFAR